MKSDNRQESVFLVDASGGGEVLHETEWACKNYKKKCCKKYKKGDQCRRCPKLAVFDQLIDQYYLVDDF